MPLPFLTADRDLDGSARTPRTASAVPDALPHEHHDQWRRPYRPGPWRVGGAAVLLLFASYLLISGLIIGLAGPVAGSSACVVLALALIALALRLLRVGIWVSENGLRQVGLLYTRTLPWPDLASVRTVQQPVKWLGLPRTVQGQGLLIVPKRGEALRPLLTDHNADFLHRPEAFDRAADLVEAWAAERRY